MSGTDRPQADDSTGDKHVENKAAHALAADAAAWYPERSRSDSTATRDSQPASKTATAGKVQQESSESTAASIMNRKKSPDSLAAFPGVEISSSARALSSDSTPNITSVAKEVQNNDTQALPAAASARSLDKESATENKAGKLLPEVQLNEMPQSFNEAGKQHAALDSAVKDTTASAYTAPEQAINSRASSAVNPGETLKDSGVKDFGPANYTARDLSSSTVKDLSNTYKDLSSSTPKDLTGYTTKDPAINNTTRDWAGTSISGQAIQPLSKDMLSGRNIAAAAVDNEILSASKQQAAEAFYPKSGETKIAAVDHETLNASKQQAPEAFYPKSGEASSPISTGIEQGFKATLKDSGQLEKSYGLNDPATKSSVHDYSEPVAKSNFGGDLGTANLAKAYADVNKGYSLDEAAKASAHPDDLSKNYAGGESLTKSYFKGDDLAKYANADQYDKKAVYNDSMNSAKIPYGIPADTAINTGKIQYGSPTDLPINSRTAYSMPAEQAVYSSKIASSMDLAANDKIAYGYADSNINKIQSGMYDSISPSKIPSGLYDSTAGQVNKIPYDLSSHSMDSGAISKIPYDLNHSMDSGAFNKIPAGMYDSSGPVTKIPSSLYDSAAAGKIPSNVYDSASAGKIPYGLTDSLNGSLNRTSPLEGGGMSDSLRRSVDIGQNGANEMPSKLQGGNQLGGLLNNTGSESRLPADRKPDSGENAGSGPRTESPTSLTPRDQTPARTAEPQEPSRQPEARTTQPERSSTGSPETARPQTLQPAGEAGRENQSARPTTPQPEAAPHKEQQQQAPVVAANPASRPETAGSTPARAEAPVQPAPSNLARTSITEPGPVALNNHGKVEAQEAGKPQAQARIDGPVSLSSLIQPPQARESQQAARPLAEVTGPAKVTGPDVVAPVKVTGPADVAPSAKVIAADLTAPAKVSTPDVSPASRAGGPDFSTAAKVTAPGVTDLSPAARGPAAGGDLASSVRINAPLTPGADNAGAKAQPLDGRTNATLTPAGQRGEGPANIAGTGRAPLPGALVGPAGRGDFVATGKPGSITNIAGIRGDAGAGRIPLTGRLPGGDVNGGKRYLTGIEIGLLIAAAGIAKSRFDARKGEGAQDKGDRAARQFSLLDGARRFPVGK